MTHTKAIEQLGEQGYTIGEILNYRGVIKRIIGKDGEEAPVEIGLEMQALAAGETTLREIRERHVSRLQG
jgi:hypothetical protein